MKESINIFLTGVTGLIGGEVAIELAGRGHSVQALVRAKDVASATIRLHQRFARSARAVNLVRVKPVCGDVSLPDLGLSPGSRIDILNACDIVIHAAGCTRFDELVECDSINVDGTRRLLTLATDMPLLRKLFHLSSASVCTAPHGSEIDETQPMEGHANAYVSSKREAERIVRNSGVFWTILRPSVVVSEGIADRMFARSILWMLRAAKLVGGLPVRSASRVDIVPVQYVAQTIANLVEEAESLAHDCYHISAGSDNATRCDEAIEALRATSRQWRTFSFMTEKEWRKNASISHIHRRLMRSIEHYIPFIKSDVTYSRQRLEEELGAKASKCAKFSTYCVKIMEQITVNDALLEAASP